MLQEPAAPNDGSRNRVELTYNREEYKGLRQINSLHAKFFRWNIHIYLHFMSLLQIDMTQVLKSFLN